MKYFAVLLSLIAPTLVQAQDLTGTLAHIRDSGEMTIGYRVAHPPLSFADDGGLANGYSVRICQEIAKDVAVAVGRDDIKVTYLTVDSQDRFDAIEDGTIDILCGATTKTLTRSERVGFTQLTFVTGGTLLSLNTNRMDSLADLDGQSIAVTSGTTTEAALTDLVSDASLAVEVVSVASAQDGFDALNAGEVAAIAADQIVLIGQVLAQADQRGDYFLSGNLISFEPYALAIPRGDADFALVADRTISRLFRTGQIVSIYQRSFGSYGLEPPRTLLALYELMSTPE